MRPAFYILILLSLLGGSCSCNRNNHDNAKIIPEKDLISILIDVHITDGLLSLQKIRDQYASFDSTSNYISVIEKHGYTKKSMDKTLESYFLNNPTKLIKIYDKVLGILSERESLIEKEILLEEGHRENLWKGKAVYLFPNTSGNDSSSFDITIGKQGTYTLSFSATIFPDDQSVNPRITAYSCRKDSLTTGKKDYFKTINYIKDGQSHSYSFIIRVPENTILQLRGSLFDFDDNPAVCEKHAWFQNIFLTFIATAG